MQFKKINLGYKILFTGPDNIVMGDCPCCCWGCDPGTTPENLLVTIDGIEAGGDCCEGLNGEYIIPWAGMDANNTRCLWESVFDTSICGFDLIHVWAYSPYSSSVSLYNVQFRSAANSIAWIALSAPTMPACENFSMSCEYLDHTIGYGCSNIPNSTAEVEIYVP